jgi:hypothetical protein
MTDQFPQQSGGFGDAKADRAAAKAYAKAQRPLWKKKRVIIPAVFVGLAVVSAAAGGGGGTDTVNTASDAETETDTEAPSTEAPAATKAPEKKAAPADAGPDYPGKLKGDKAAKPGEPIELSGWTMTASAIESTPSPFGTEQLCSTLSFTNRDDEQQEYGPLSWKLQFPNGAVSDPSYIGDNHLESGGLAPGGKIDGKQVCFEDEAAGPGQYILFWQPDVFSSEKRGAWLNTI